MRASGILLPVLSLPSPHGIGTLGRDAYQFIEFLAEAGQTYWQLLPLGPTGFGNSPYQSFSSFAGNPYLIDLDLLQEQGLLLREEIEDADRAGAGREGGSEILAPDRSCDEASRESGSEALAPDRSCGEAGQKSGSDAFGPDRSCGRTGRINYAALQETRLPLLRRAGRRFFDGRQPADYQDFLEREQAWLPDYALFMACRESLGGCWWNWPEGLRMRRPASMAEYGERLQEAVGFHCFLQYTFYRQWEGVKACASSMGIRTIGDLPIYVAPDSADVWASPHLFQLDPEGRPLAVAGVPPDYFSEDGQLWGNPLYDWERMRQDGFAWWMDRLRGAARLYDLVRIDHFRGLESYWAVPYGEQTARNGCWCQGPGRELIQRMKEPFSDRIIAEDLGILTQGVRDLLEYSGFPGMKILQFAFAPDGSSDYLPHKYQPHCICCTGTHDNKTLNQWFAEASAEERHFATEYLGLNEKEGIARGLIRGGMSSPAELFMTQMQDWLELGQEGRMNIPGTLGEQNWSWRLLPGQLTPSLAGDIRKKTERYGRNKK